MKNYFLILFTMIVTTYSGYSQIENCFDPAIITNVPCTFNFEPVCACDGLTYTNYCFAEKSGNPNSTYGECVKYNFAKIESYSCIPWVRNRIHAILESGGYNVIVEKAFDKTQFSNQYFVFRYNIIDEFNEEIYSQNGTLFQHCTEGLLPLNCNYLTNYTFNYPQDFQNIMIVWDEIGLPDCDCNLSNNEILCLDKVESEISNRCVDEETPFYVINIAAIYRNYLVYLRYG